MKVKIFLFLALWILSICFWQVGIASLFSLEKFRSFRKATDVDVFIDMINDRLTYDEHKYLTWEKDGKTYSFREWMMEKYRGCRLDLSKEELAREADRIVREYRGG